MADTMASTFQNIGGLLEKMESPDQDYRFMAISDMIVQIQKNTINLDDDTEQKVVRKLLKLLEDKNGEVQNITVKCLGLLIMKVKRARIETIVATLCNNAMSEKDGLRDISNIGLKTVISQLPLDSEDIVINICECIIIELIKAIKGEDVSIQFEALELLVELLKKFGNFVKSDHMYSIFRAILPKFCSPRQAVQKRSIAVCSIMVRFCDDLVYNDVMNHIWGEFVLNRSNIHIYVQSISCVCREASERFKPHIERFLPLILQYSSKENDDIRESCLHALQAFQLCPEEITSHLSEIISVCLEHIKYDPNYNYDYDEEDEDMCKSDTTDEESDFCSDDDDTTWKVRRAAAKCIESLITNRKELVLEFYHVLSSTLIDRFKERDEAVKSDVFNAYIALLNQTKLLISANTSSKNDVTIMFQQQIPDLTKALSKQMKQKNFKILRSCFGLLNVLCDVLPEALNLYINDVIPGLLYCLNKQKSNTIIMLDSLSFIQHLLTFQQAEALKPYINEILPLILECVEHAYYKISARGLVVLQELIKAIRPLNSSLNASDIEVKEEAILTMGQIISHYGDCLQKDLTICLELLMDCLRSDVTRLATIKTFIMIAMSPLHVDLSVINEVVFILISFLHHNQRILKGHTLHLLDCLIQNYHDHINIDNVNFVTVELATLLDESDLHLAQMALALLKTIAQYHPAALQDVGRTVLPEIIKLLKSPLLQGSALTAAQQFLQNLVKCNLPGLKCNDLIQMLLESVLQIGDAKENNYKHIYDTLSKCLASITTACKNHNLLIIDQFLQNIKANESLCLCMFSLLVIGEIGRETDLASVSHLKNTIMQSFLIESEDVRLAASYALGCIAIGNLQTYLPIILQEIQMQTEQKYLILLALKEVISSASASPKDSIELSQFIPRIWQQLFLQCKSTEEGIRNVTSECIGKLTLIDPPHLLPKLEKTLSDLSPLVREVVVLAVKYTILEQRHPIDDFLCQNIKQFLIALQDTNLKVRHAALILFNSIAHNKLFLIKDLLNSLLPFIYKETKINETLIHEVVMGPFKHTVDEGLDLRKAAFECMYTLLNNCINVIDVYEFLSHTEAGLKDHYDIKMLTYLMVERLAQLCPKEVIQEIDNIVKPIQDTCAMKISTKSVQQDYERLDELKKCALRTLLVLQNMPKQPINDVH